MLATLTVLEVGGPTLLYEIKWALKNMLYEIK
jgi:hypothetical protein